MPYYNPHHGNQTLMADIHPSNYAMTKSIMENQRIDIAELNSLLGIEDGSMVDVQAGDLRQKLGRRSSLCMRHYSLNSSETECLGDDRSVASNNTIETIEITLEHDEANKQPASDSGLGIDTDSERDLVEDVPAPIAVKRIIHWAIGSALEDRMIQDSQDKNEDALSAFKKTDAAANENKGGDVELDSFSAKSKRTNDEGNEQEAAAPPPPAIPAQPEDEGSGKGSKDSTTTSSAGQGPPPPPPNGASPAAGGGSGAAHDGAQKTQYGSATPRRISWRQRRKRALRKFKRACKGCCCFGVDHAQGEMFGRPTRTNISSGFRLI